MFGLSMWDSVCTVSTTVLTSSRREPQAFTATAITYQLFTLHSFESRASKYVNVGQSHILQCNQHFPTTFRAIIYTWGHH